jgi:DNA-directed RNA polymerase specialized sigma24 family protein
MAKRRKGPPDRDRASGERKMTDASFLEERREGASVKGRGHFREGRSAASKSGKKNRGWQSFRSDDANKAYAVGYSAGHLDRSEGREDHYRGYSEEREDDHRAYKEGYEEARRAYQAGYEDAKSGAHASPPHSTVQEGFSEGTGVSKGHAQQSTPTTFVLYDTFRELEPQLRAAAFKMLGDTSRIDHLIQQTYLLALTRLSSEGANPLVLLQTVLTELCRDEKLRKERVQRAFDQLPTDAPTTKHKHDIESATEEEQLAILSFAFRKMRTDLKDARESIKETIKLLSSEAKK